jgi:hypothetical protein
MYEDTVFESSTKLLSKEITTAYIKPSYPWIASDRCEPSDPVSLDPLGRRDPVQPVT